MKHDAAVKRFSEEYGVPTDAVELLCDKAERLADFQTEEHNDPKFAEKGGPKILKRMTLEFTLLAKGCGFDGVRWDNLYPTLVKGAKQFIELPLD